MKRALVLGGGGSYGIAWESGILAGLAQAGLDGKEADFIVGTSAGSQVGTAVASGLSWEEIWERQVDPLLQSGYVSPQVDVSALLRRFAQIQAEAKSPQQWLLDLGVLSLKTATVSETQRLEEIEQRLRLSEWPERLGVVGVETLSGKRVAWTKESSVDLVRAVAASSALPGVYPAITVDGHQYCDGGVYSMENADLAEGYERVLILSVGLPIQTPYQLERQVESLRGLGVKVEVIQPGQEVLSVLHQSGGNPLNPELRAPVARAAKKQGLLLYKRLSPFWNDCKRG